MFKFRQIKLNKIKGFFKKWLRVLGENLFLTSLSLILISLIIGSFVFYRYSVLVEEREPETAFKSSSLEEEKIREILKIWETRQENLEEADLKVYPNPFRLTK